MAISPDGNKILTGDKDGKLLTWDIKTMTLNSQISGINS
jgi:WD40 repeat protein